MPQKCPRTTVLVLLTLSVALPAPAQQRQRTDVGATTKIDPKVAEALEKMRAAQKTTKAMTSAFRQVKEDALFAEPSIQTGRFTFASPDRFRWDYEQPQRVIVVATKDTFQRYLPDQKLLRKLDLSKNRRRVFSLFGLGSDVEVLQRHFNVSLAGDPAHPNTSKLELVGKRRRIQKRLALLEMWLDRETWLPAIIKVTMASGGTTLWEFTDTKLNPEITDQTFTVQIAKGTVIQSEADPSSPLVDELMDDEDAQAGKPPEGRP